MSYDRRFFFVFFVFIAGAVVGSDASNCAARPRTAWDGWPSASAVAAAAKSEASAPGRALASAFAVSSRDRARSAFRKRSSRASAANGELSPVVVSVR